MKRKIVYISMVIAGVIAMNLITSMQASSAKTYRPVVRGKHWALSTRNPLATQAGVQIFQKGGNAIDAVIASLATLGVVEPTMSGIGGEAFFLVHDPDAPSKVRCINGGGTAPQKATIEWFRKNKYDYIPDIGIRAGVVPGTVDAWIVTLDLYGTMSLQDVFEPAITLARDGFPVSDSFAEWLKGDADALEAFDSSRKLYFKESGELYKPGEIFRNADLARTMQRMVDAEQAALGNGRSRAMKAARDEFYKGAIALDFIRYSEEHGGLFSREDFAGYRALLEEPAHTSYKEYEIYKPASNNQGPAELFALKIAEDFPLSSWDWYSAPFIHYLAEAVNLAMADREQYVGDLNFVSTPLNGLFSPGYAAERRKLISPDKRRAGYLPGNPYPYENPPYEYAPMQYNFTGNPEKHPVKENRLRPDAEKPLKYWRSSLNSSQDQRFTSVERMGHTSYACAADEEGNVISATPSLFMAYGCKEVIDGLGFPLTNRLTYFHLDDKHANGLAPGKRPRNTITPSMAFKDGKPFLAYGTPGGDQQCQALMQMLISIVDYGKNVQESIDAPIFQSLCFPNSYSPFTYADGTIELDRQTDPAVAKILEGMGWKVRWVSEFGNNNGCAVLIDPVTGVFSAGAVSSKENMAAAW